MHNRPLATQRGYVFAALVLGAAACKQSAIIGPKPEVVKADVKVDLPAVPAFDLPPANPDGSQSVKAMRVQGRKMLNNEISVRGIVTWAYDCPTALKQPGWTDEDVQKYINEDTSRCERPKFYLGDSASTPVEKSIWVVDVPRPPFAVEVERLPKEEIKAWPAVPPYKVGDEIIVTGSWVQASPHSERNNEGLLVYKKLRNVTQNWETPVALPDALPAATKAPPKH